MEGILRIEGEDIEVALDDNLIDLASSINNAFEDQDFVLTAAVDDENRLVIEGSPEKPYPFQIVDPDSIAGVLGLVEQDESGNLQVANELIAPQKAEVEVDDVAYSFGTNRLSSLFPGLDIELLPEGLSRLEDEFGAPYEAPIDVEIRVERDITGPKQALLEFVGVL